MRGVRKERGREGGREEREGGRVRGVRKERGRGVKYFLTPMRP